MPGKTLEVSKESIKDDLNQAVSAVFDQAQNSATNHSKNFVALYKRHVEVAQYTELVKKGKGVKLSGERMFEDIFTLLLTRTLPLRKGVGPADRIIKFAAGYTRFVNEKAAEERDALGANEDDDEGTTASRFTAYILKFLLKGFSAKDKNVRYRVISAVTQMVDHLGEINEELYDLLRSGLTDRINDREAPIRVQAVMSLSKLCGSEDVSEIEEGEGALELVLETLAYDPSPEVRKAVLVNLPIDGMTIPHILNRTRDTDNNVRKIIYFSVLKDNTTQSTSGGSVLGPTHPRAFTIEQRELIVKNGLGDREPPVRAAAAALISTWVDVAELKAEKSEPDSIKDEDNTKVEKGVIALLSMFDVVRSEVLSDIADMLKSSFITRPEIFDNIEFGAEYWLNLTPETAFLARVFVEHCNTTKDDARLEAALPEVTALAFHIQSQYNNLTEFNENLTGEQVVRDLSKDELELKSEERSSREFVLAEILRLAIHLDYSDEIGRRKMFKLVRDMLSKEVLPESLVSPCLDVLRELSANERDLILVVVEIVQDLRDPETGEEEEPPTEADGDTSFGSTPATVKPPRLPLFLRPRDELPEEDRVRLDQVDLKCLTMCIGMLERVNGTFEDNSTLEAILQELIIPSVRRKEKEFRKRGCICLGLCCLIAQKLALNSIELFLKQIPSSPDDLKTTLIQAIFDMLMVHDAPLFRGSTQVTLHDVTHFLIKQIGEQTDHEVLALLCKGIAKLVLAGLITDPEAVINLIKAYLSPMTVDNQELRQCLTYFFQAFSFSSAGNQQVMQKIFFAVFKDVAKDRQELDDDEEMISPSQLCALFAYWTNPESLSIIANTQADHKEDANDTIQVDLAGAILRGLFEKEGKFEKEDKKALFQLLTKLHLPDKIDDIKIGNLKLLADSLRSRHPPRDTVSNTAFTKFETTITKKYEKQLEGFSEVEYRKFEQLNELFDFLDSIIPDDDDDLIDVIEPKKKGRKRRSQSIASTSTETEFAGTPPPAKDKGNKRSKRRRLSGSDDEFDEDERSTNQGSPPPPRPPTREVPKRAVAGKKQPQVIIISSDDDERSTPVPRRRATTSRARSVPSRVKEEEREEDIDRDLSNLLRTDVSSDLSRDSIMDPDSEDEEEEVNDLLAED